MAHISSEIQDISSKDGSAGSGNPIRPPVCDHTFTEDSELRSMVEESAFQVLSEGSLIKRPRYTFRASEPEVDNDFLSLTFPRKLWKIVESDQFKSIWWDENGTSIVINEALFEKEVLERKAPFRIFETDSMKSLVRQLNLYGFSKMRQNVQRSASLADFLAEEREVSVLSKLQFYQNANFKRGCPQLLVRMKRRVGIKNASVQDVNKKHFRSGGNMDNQNSGLAGENSAESLFATSENLNIAPIRKPPTRQRIANKIDTIKSDFYPPSSALVGPTKQTVPDQRSILNQLTTFHMQSHSSYTQANGRIVNLVTTTTSMSQYHIVSPLQNSYFGLMAEPSPSPTRYPHLPAHEAPFANLLSAGIPWFPMPMRVDSTAASPSRPPHQPPSLYEHPPNSN
ncbi:heat shock transcription factor, Y-linked-like [Tupaia chinensis]|uniref:heat shock transcription factor, Y-linked-like n=1 Tax=Tupaia chinensis TaxID=246437 RepID=UPI0003C91617|nr:heat shock transcription factor, Y-linked-like [Tupaia chinensis]